MRTDGKDVVRCYSLSSAPAARGYLEISVRRQGQVSNALHALARPGSLLSVRAPAGHFTYPGGDDRPLVLLAGGIGITPLMSMVRHALLVEPTRPVTLLYSARDVGEFAFRDELLTLGRRHDQLQVCFAVTRGEAPPDVYRGRIDERLITAVAPEIRHAVSMICGPQAMIDGLTATLQAMGVPADQVRSERFEAAVAASAGPPRPARDATDSGGETFQIRERRSAKSAPATAGQTLLDAAEAHGLRHPVVLSGRRVRHLPDTGRRGPGRVRRRRSRRRRPRRRLRAGLCGVAAQRLRDRGGLTMATPTLTATRPDRHPAPAASRARLMPLGALMSVMGLAAIVAVAVTLWVLVGLDGWTYYRTPLAVRGYSPTHRLLRPSGPVGQTLGVAGAALMLVPFFYMAYKRLHASQVGRQPQASARGAHLLRHRRAGARHLPYGVQVQRPGLGGVLVDGAGGAVGIRRPLSVRAHPAHAYGVSSCRRPNSTSAPPACATSCSGRPAPTCSTPSIGSKPISPADRCGSRAWAIGRSDWRWRNWSATLERRSGEAVSAAIRAALDERLRLQHRRSALAATRRLFDLWHVFHLPLVWVMFAIVSLHVGVSLYLGYVPFRW